MVSHPKEAKNPAHENGGHDDESSTLGIQQYQIPKTIATKLAKSAVPENVKLAKEIPLALSRSAAVYISYLGIVAKEIAKEAGKKTIIPAHIFEAIKSLHEDDANELLSTLKGELKAYRAQVEAKKAAKSKPTPKSTGAGAAPAAASGSATARAASAGPSKEPIEIEYEEGRTAADEDNDDIAAYRRTGEDGDEEAGDDEEIDEEGDEDEEDEEMEEDEEEEEVRNEGFQEDDGGGSDVEG